MSSNCNCNGSGPHSGEEVRVLPTGGDSNAILCFSCYRREMNFRQERNSEQAGRFGWPVLSESAKFKLPAWESLKVYGS